MAWNRWYVIRSYVRSSLWIVPFVAFLLYLATIRVMGLLEAWTGWTIPWPYGVSGAQVVLETAATLTLSFLVFTFGSLLVAIQVASGQLTPRIIATTLLRDNAIRFTVGLFIFSLLFATGARIRLETSGPQLITWVAGFLGLFSIVAFLFLIDYAARLLRPVSIVWRVGENGLAVIETVYPDAVEERPASELPQEEFGSPQRVVRHRGKSAIIIAVNLDAIVAHARSMNGTIEFAHHVGDFVAVGEPLFLLYGGGADAIDERKLRETVAFGPERTIEQDSTFALRIIVDIATKALSKAINDPTTAVLAIDQLHRLLRVVGKRRLLGEHIRDGDGRLRVIFRTPNWDDFVHLACCEIRHYGAENVQVARRLRAMIENLIQTLPEYRRAALHQELALLDSSLVTLYPLPQDLALARVPDTQGLGGPSRT